MDRDSLGPTTDVLVSVSATVTLPLHLKVLESLEDAALEEDIMKEAVHLALAEKLYGFEKMNVTVTRKHGRPSCEAKLDLADLCSAIANVRHMYSHAMTKLLIVQNMIREAMEGERKKTGSDEHDCASLFLTIAEVLQEALDGPGEAPLAVGIRECARGGSTTAHDAPVDKGEKDDDKSVDTAASFDDVFYDPLVDGYEPLLDCDRVVIKENDGNENGD